MKCLYKHFRQESNGWTVELSTNMKITFHKSGMIVNSEEASFIEKLREKRRQFKNTRKSKESSNYSTSKEFQKLFESLDTTSEEEDSIQTSENPYKPFPDFLKDIEKNLPSRSHSTSENQSYNLIEIEKDSFEDVALDSDHLCKKYKSVEIRFSRKRKRKKLRRDKIELKNIEIHEEGHFEQRCLRGRIRLMKLEKRRFKENIINRNQFATLGEVLHENGLPSDTVICCSLCRLLISKNVREEFFMAPCDCSEKFIHTKCALLHHHKMVRLKCDDCQTFYKDRIVCRSSASGITNLEELELYRMNKMTEEEIISKKETHTRLPAEFEYDCFICFNSRSIREDKFETIDSAIIRPCRCNVTCHNECLVKTLIERRFCVYCNYRYEFSTIESRLGYFNGKVGLSSGLLYLSVITISIILAIMVFHFVNTSNSVVNIIIHNGSVALIFVIAAYKISSIIRASKRRSQERNRKAVVVIKPYQPRSVIKEGNIKRAFERQYEEISFEEIENRYGRAIKRFLELSPW